MNTKLLASLLVVLMVASVLGVAGTVRSVGAEQLAPVQWEKTYKTGDDTQDKDTWFMSVQQTSDGGYIAAGGADTGIGAGVLGGYLLKVDASGAEDWHAVFAPDFTEYYFTCVQQTSDGGYIAAGQSFRSDDNVVLVKYNVHGGVEWSKNVFGDNPPHNQVALCILQTADGGYFIGGDFVGVEQVGNSWLAKTDDHGTVQWVKPSTFTGTGVDRAASIEHTSDGRYVVAGSCSNGLAVTKLDSLGNIVWSYAYSEVKSRGLSIHETDGGGFIIATGVGLAKIDTTGRFEWYKEYSTSDSAVSLTSAQQTLDGSYLAIGNVIPSGQAHRAGIVKTDNLGALQWAKVVPSAETQIRSGQLTTDGWYIGAGLKARTTASGTQIADAYLVKFGPQPTQNTAPKIDALTVTPATAALGKSVTATATFTDPDTSDTHTATFVWGDGTSDTVTVAAGVRTVSGTHAYTKASPATGPYTVTCRVSDGTDTSPDATATVKVVSAQSVAGEVRAFAASLSASDFNTAQNYNAYVNKLSALADLIAAGDYADAQAKIGNDLLKRNDQWGANPGAFAPLDTIVADLSVLQAAQG
ncbi:MAG: hypothetical protein ACXV4C_09065 [Halobacteriota archaeon]